MKEWIHRAAYIKGWTDRETYMKGWITLRSVPTSCMHHHLSLCFSQVFGGFYCIFFTETNLRFIS